MEFYLFRSIRKIQIFTLKLFAQFSATSLTHSCLLFVFFFLARFIFMINGLTSISPEVTFIICCVYSRFNAFVAYEIALIHL